MRADNKLNINTLSFKGGKGTFNTQGFVKIKTKNDSISIEETNIAIKTITNKKRKIFVLI